MGRSYPAITDSASCLCSGSNIDSACCLTATPRRAAVWRRCTTQLVLYTCTTRLLQELRVADGDGSFGRRLAQLARIDVLALKDFAGVLIEWRWRLAIGETRSAEFING